MREKSEQEKAIEEEVQEGDAIITYERFAEKRGPR